MSQKWISQKMLLNQDFCDHFKTLSTTRILKIKGGMKFDFHEEYDVTI